MDIKKISELARIKLTKDEEKKFEKEIGDVLKAFQNLNKVQTKDVKPSFHVIPTLNESRADKPEKPLTQKQALQNSGKTERSYIKSPKIK